MAAAGFRVIAAALLSLCAAGAQAVPAGSAWALQLPEQAAASYRGAPDYAATGGAPGGMLYPAPGVAGLLVAVLTHAAIAEGAKNAQMKKLQEQADTVLGPLRPQVDAITHAELLQLTLDRLRGQGVDDLPAATAGRWTIASTPTFYMLQDRRALVLENSFSVFAPGDTAKPARTVTVRALSAARLEPEPLAAWESPGNLKHESVRLLAHSVAILLDDLRRPKGEEAPFRTVRYLEGDQERTERAQVLGVGCQRQVVRTLRGWLMSVPVKADPDSAAPACDPAEFKLR